MNLVVVILMVIEMVVNVWRDRAKKDRYGVVVLTFVRITTYHDGRRVKIEMGVVQ